MVQLGLHLRLVGQGLLCKSKARLFSGQLRQIEAHKTVETALLYNNEIDTTHSTPVRKELLC